MKEKSSKNFQKYKFNLSDYYDDKKDFDFKTFYLQDET